MCLAQPLAIGSVSSRLGDRAEVPARKVEARLADARHFRKVCRLGSDRASEKEEDSGFPYHGLVER